MMADQKCSRCASKGNLAICNLCESIICSPYEYQDGSNKSDAKERLCKCSNVCSYDANIVCANCVFCCKLCDHEYCNSCLTKCMYCHNKICRECTEDCALCNDEICNDCNTKCSLCQNIVCKECRIKCNSCGTKVCKKCSKRCRSCDNKLCILCCKFCYSCKEKHYNYSFCDVCVELCNICNKTLCTKCLQTCSKCDTSVCKSHLTKHICSKCDQTTTSTSTSSGFKITVVNRSNIIYKNIDVNMTTVGFNSIYGNITLDTGKIVNIGDSQTFNFGYKYKEIPLTDDDIPSVGCDLNIMIIAEPKDIGRVNRIIEIKKIFHKAKIMPKIISEDSPVKFPLEPGLRGIAPPNMKITLFDGRNDKECIRVKFY